MKFEFGKWRHFMESVIIKKKERKINSWELPVNISFSINIS